MISDYWANKLNDLGLKNTSVSQPATVYLALATGPIVRSDTVPANEVSGGSYARKAVTFASSVNGLSRNSAAVTFDAPTADWGPSSGPIEWWAIMDASSSGHIMYFGRICPRIVVNGGKPPTFPIHSIAIGLDQGCGGC